MSKSFRARYAPTAFGFAGGMLPDEPDPTEGGTGKPAEKETPAEKPEGNVDDLPEWARKSLTKANNEAAASRIRIKELEPLAAEAQSLKDANLSDLDKAKKEATSATERADIAEQRALILEVAHDKGLTTSQAGRLRGKTKAELEADADELLQQFAPAKGNENDGKSGTLRRKPAENLRGGGNVEDEPGETDPHKIAAAVKRRF